MFWQEDDVVFGHLVLVLQQGWDFYETFLLVTLPSVLRFTKGKCFLTKQIIERTIRRLQLNGTITYDFSFCLGIRFTGGLADALESANGKNIVIVTRRGRREQAIIDIDQLEGLLAAEQPDYLAGKRRSQGYFSHPGRV